MGLNSSTAKLTVNLFYFQAQGQQRTESFFMGNGGISGPTSPTSATAAGSAPFCRAAMDDEPVPAKNNSSRICDHCSSKFSLFNRKVRALHTYGFDLGTGV